MSYHYLVLATVLGLRLWELSYSWRLLEADRAAGLAESIPDPVFPAMVGLHTAWLMGCLVEVVAVRPEFRSGLVLSMMLMWALALGLRFWVILSMGGAWNVRLVKRKKQLVVTSGPYRYIRHPNYVAVILEIAVVPLLVGAYWTALLGSLANAWVLWRRIAGEEAYLFKNPAYRKAFAEKSRLIPGVF